ncbi:MAG: hypothetical protein JHC84_18175 [Solirubrobacteraceae bacterium]|nr:hypothetical protein [Solirubrobacteraceae bacterium]
MGLFKNMKDTMAGAQQMAASAQQQAGISGTDLAGGIAARDGVQAAGNEMVRIMQTGSPGTAIIKAARDTGQRTAGNATCEFDLTVTPEGGAPYDTTLVTMIAGTDMAPYELGKTWNVKIDPNDGSKVVFSQ